MNALLVGLACFAARDRHARLAAVAGAHRQSRARDLGARNARDRRRVEAQFAGPFAYWPAAAVSGFGAVCWLFAFSAVYKSVSLRILTQLARAPGHAMPLETITEEYVRPEFESRVALLVKMGCAEATDEGYAATATGNDTARRIETIRRACGVSGSGLYDGNALEERSEDRGQTSEENDARSDLCPLSSDLSDSVSSPVP